MKNVFCQQKSTSFSEALKPAYLHTYIVLIWSLIRLTRPSAFVVADDFNDVVASGVGGGYVDDDNVTAKSTLTTAAQTRWTSAIYIVVVN